MIMIMRRKKKWTKFLKRMDGKMSKIRAGFVSNSSSASFVISLDDLSAKQLRMITDGSSINFENFEDYECWSINVNDEEVSGYTSLDNFNFYDYLVEDVKVDPSKIKYERY